MTLKTQMQMPETCHKALKRTKWNALPTIFGPLCWFTRPSHNIHRSALILYVAGAGPKNRLEPPYSFCNARFPAVPAKSHFEETPNLQTQILNPEIPSLEPYSIFGKTCGSSLGALWPKLEDALAFHLQKRAGSRA